MKPLESHLSATGLTTVPKALRMALGLSHGARLVWHQLPTGAVSVTVKHVYPQAVAMKSTS